MPFSQSELTRVLNAAYPANATLGHVALLDGSSALDLPVTVNSGSLFTASGTFAFVTGSALRFNSTGVLPGGMLPTVDYFAVKQSATTFYLAATKAQALANQPFGLGPPVGTGNMTVSQRQPDITDTLADLLTYELPFFIRRPLLGGSNALFINNAQDVFKRQVVSFSNTGTSAVTYRQALVLFGGNDTIGSSAGVTGHLLLPATAAQVIGVQQLAAITIDLRLRSI
jgi:hypothetical protein